jgi:hypothetical protein
MKSKENLSQMSNEVLIKNYKSAKGIYIAFAAIFVLLLISCLYLTVAKGFSVFTVLPFTFIPILIANVMSFGKVKEEMKARKLI